MNQHSQQLEQFEAGVLVQALHDIFCLDVHASGGDPASLRPCMTTLLHDCNHNQMMQAVQVHVVRQQHVAQANRTRVTHSACCMMENGKCMYTQRGKLCSLAAS